MSDKYVGVPKLMDTAKYIYSILLLFRRLYQRPSSFVFKNREYEYFEHPYNGTWMNERAIEIPLIWEEVQSHSPDRVLEVGNVLSHYFIVEHLIIDKYEHQSNVISEDVLDVDFAQKFDCIVSISTLEHVGWDEIPRVPGKYIKAIEKIRQLLSANGKFFATIPLGYNPCFDQDLFNGKLGCDQVYYFQRLTKYLWQEASLDQVSESQYGKKYRTTEGMALCIWSKK